MMKTGRKRQRFQRTKSKQRFNTGRPTHTFTTCFSLHYTYQGKTEDDASKCKCAVVDGSIHFTLTLHVQGLLSSHKSAHLSLFLSISLFPLSQKLALFPCSFQGLCNITPLVKIIITVRNCVVQNVVVSQVSLFITVMLRLWMMQSLPILTLLNSPVRTNHL